MSSFKVTLTVPAGELGSILSHLSRKQLAGVEMVPVQESVSEEGGNKPSRSAPMSTNTILVRSGKDGTPTAKKVRLSLVEHEKLEAKHGVGTVTRRQLNQIIKAKVSTAYTPIVHKLVAENWLQPL